MVQRLADLIPLFSAAAACSALGCNPEVVIARNDPGGSGGAATAGSGGTDIGGGGGDLPGEGGSQNVIVQPPRLLADSVADFSLTQGELGWQYGYDTGSLDSFTPMARTSVITQYVPPSADKWECWAIDTTHWTQIFQLGAHPNGTLTSTPSRPVLQRAVRRWVSTYAGDVAIFGEIAKIDVITGSNGVDASVYVDGTSMYSTMIGGDDGGGRAYRVPATLQVGSTVDFVLDPHEGDDHHDLTRFTGIIVRVGP